LRWLLRRSYHFLVLASILLIFKLFVYINMNFILSIEIRFIGHKHDDHIWSAMCSTLLDPIAYAFKWFSSSDIVNQNGSSSGTIILSGNRFKGLLTSSVPNLEFNFFILQIEYFSTKFHPYRHFMFDSEFAFKELIEDTAFTYGCVSNDYEFKEIMIRHYIIIYIIWWTDLIIRDIKHYPIFHKCFPFWF